MLKHDGWFSISTKILPNNQTGAWFNFRLHLAHIVFYTFILWLIWFSIHILFFITEILSLFLHRNGRIISWNGTPMIMAASIHYMYHPNTYGYRILCCITSEYRNTKIHLYCNHLQNFSFEKFKGQPVKWTYFSYGRKEFYTRHLFFLFFVCFVFSAIVKLVNFQTSECNKHS